MFLAYSSRPVNAEEPCVARRPPAARRGQLCDCAMLKLWQSNAQPDYFQKEIAAKRPNLKMAWHTRTVEYLNSR